MCNQDGRSTFLLTLFDISVAFTTNCHDIFLYWLRWFDFSHFSSVGFVGAKYLLIFYRCLYCLFLLVYTAQNHKLWGGSFINFKTNKHVKIILCILQLKSPLIMESILLSSQDAWHASYFWTTLYHTKCKYVNRIWFVQIVQKLKTIELALASACGLPEGNYLGTERKITKEKFLWSDSVVLFLH